MERVINQDERIRRAEELYAKRQTQIENKRNIAVNVEQGKQNKTSKKLIKQFIICLIIYGVFYGVKSTPNLVSEETMYKISDVLEYDINIQELYKKFSGYIKEKKEPSSLNENEELIEETLSATDILDDNEPLENNENVEAEKYEETEETNVVEECSSISQMEVDAEFIKANYSLIKPLEGEITSRYGIRNPTVATVPKYHTGIDIARVTGTVIVSAMEGTVELVSSKGDYGNHIKITNGELSTLYAHCSKIYVAEGAYITQGQEIAEVGATGNVTGPHLHFEIRRNNQYVDPDLILNF